MAEKRAVANWVMLILLFAIAGAAVAAPICNVSPAELDSCRPAVTGPSPKAPTPACCSVVKKVDIPCLCRLKSELPRFGINPAYVFVLPKKCGVNIKIPCAA